MFTNSSIKKIVSVFVTTYDFHFEQINSSILLFTFGEMPNKHHYEIVVTKTNKTYSLNLYLIDENFNYVDSFDSIYEYYYNLDKLCNRIQSLIDKYIHNCNF